MDDTEEKVLHHDATRCILCGIRENPPVLNDEEPSLGNSEEGSITSDDFFSAESDNSEAPIPDENFDSDVDDEARIPDDEEISPIPAIDSSSATYSDRELSSSDLSLSADSSLSTSSDDYWVPEVGIDITYPDIQQLERKLHGWAHRTGFELRRYQSRFGNHPRGMVTTLEVCITILRPFLLLLLLACVANSENILDFNSEFCLHALWSSLTRKGWRSIQAPNFRVAAN